MNNFNLIQILPELKSGGVEQGTIDVANFLASKKIKTPARRSKEIGRGCNRSAAA